MRHRGKNSSRLSLRARQRFLRLEQLEVRQMLAGDLVSGMVAPGWFGSYAAANRLRHTAAPSITASDTSIALNAQSAGNAIGQMDWIVQFNTASVSGMANAADAVRLLPHSGVQFQIIEGLGAVGEVLVRSYGATAAQAATALRSDGQIAWFEVDSLKQITATPNDSQFSQQWSLSNSGQNGGTAQADIHATQAWGITTGSRNVVVAVIDSGVDYTHPDLAANIWTNPNAGRDGFSGDIHGYNFVADNGNPMDDNGHGTHVAGIIGAVGNNGTGVTGVNWNVTIMPLKFLDSLGGGYTSDAIRAINYATMERTTYGVNVRVINASWSSSDSDAGLNAAIKAAGDAGILFVTAAGNSASNNDTTPQYPANAGLPNVVSVAASDANDRLAAFSDYGASSVNLAAPGVSIYSTLPGGKYGFLSGTSMASPEVAGVAALAWAVNPSATVAQVRNALLQGVDKVPGLAGKVSSGGRLDAYNTLKLLAAPAPAPSPSPAPVTVVAPSVAAVVVNSASVTVGNSVSLIAQGVVAGTGTISGVSFYRDSNGNGQWDSSDVLVGTASSISGGQATISLSTSGLATGSYRFFARVGDSNGQWSSVVSTQLTVTAPPTKGTNVTTAVAVAIGSSVQGNMANFNDTNYFKVQLVAGQKYTFYTVLGSLYDSVLTLLGSNGQTVISQNDDAAPGNRASCITWQATSTGTYYLAVGSYPGSPVGSFLLATSGSGGSTPTPAPAVVAPTLPPIGNQTLVAGSSVTLPLLGRDLRGSPVRYSAGGTGTSAVSVVVSNNQLTIRAAANYSGSVQVAVTATNGAASAVQSFKVTVTSAKPSGRQLGRSVAIPSATLRSSAAAATVFDKSLGAATGSVSNPSRGLDPAALDTLFHAMGR